MGVSESNSFCAGTHALIDYLSSMNVSPLSEIQQIGGKKQVVKQPPEFSSESEEDEAKELTHARSEYNGNLVVTVACGGDTLSAIEKNGLGNFTYLSTGGGELTFTTTCCCVY